MLQTRSTYLLCQRRFLFGRAEFKEFLYYIVSKYVCHETVCSANYFVEYHLFLLNCGPFQFLLNKSVKKYYTRNWSYCETNIDFDTQWTNAMDKFEDKILYSGFGVLHGET